MSPKAGRAPVLALCVAGLLVLLGCGGWLVVSQQQKQQQTQQALKRTQDELEEKSKTLGILEEEREKLASSFETLKGRWAKTEGELQQTKTAAERAQEQLETASNERASLQQRLDDSEKRHRAIQGEVDQMRLKIEEAARQRAAFESQIKQAAGAGLTRAEIEQLSDVVAIRASNAKELEERMEALSHAFEQLAWKHIELQEQTGQSAPPGPSPLMAEPGFTPASASAPISKEQEKQQMREAEALSKRYRHLGEFCMAAYQYPRAAEALEKSLSYKDDPQVHATLAFLYGRLLLDPEKAALHAAFAPDGAVTAENVLSKTTQASGMPRRDRDLVWRWLANK